MIFDRPTLAMHLGASDEHLFFSYALGFERTQTVDETGQVAGPQPERPLGSRKLSKMSKAEFAEVFETEHDFLERVWAIWRYHARSRPICLSLSKGEFAYELFSRAISNDRPNRRKAGPNPIADVRSLANLPRCPRWKKTRKFRDFLPLFWQWKKQLVEIPHPLFRKDPVVITIDVEAWGLFGSPPFSIGGGVFQDNRCIEKWHFTCPPEKARHDGLIKADEAFVRKLVLPHHPDTPTHDNPEGIIEAFRKRFQYWKQKCENEKVNVVTLAGRGFPLEARLLKRAGLIQEFFDTRAWAQVFDIRHKRDTASHPLHHPVADAAAEVEVWEIIRKLIES